MRRLTQLSSLTIAFVFALVFAYLLTSEGSGGGSRTEQSILFIGNSRTYRNDMPNMLRLIAESARHPHHLRIESHAQPNASLTDHAADPRVQTLLSGDWDHVVLQAQSAELIDVANRGEWLRPAAELIKQARLNQATPSMFVTWRYTDLCSDELKWNASQNAAMHTSIQDQHASLARSTGVHLVNVGLAWERVLAQPADFSLYTDCNHPSVHGSYLSALMFFGELLEGNLSAVTYAPNGVSPQQAEMLRTVVSTLLHRQAS